MAPALQSCIYAFAPDSFCDCYTGACGTSSHWRLHAFPPESFDVCSRARPRPDCQGRKKFPLSLKMESPLQCRIVHSKIECRAGERLLSATAIQTAGRGDTDEDFTLSVPGRIVRNYHGKLEVLAEGAELVPVVNMDLEVAVASAVAAESPPLAPLEALEAQAVVTRSYYAAGTPSARAF